MGVGIDLIEIDRIERALERRPALAQRLFTPAERAFAEVRRRPARHLAARFAAKEATVKALGLSVMRPLEIEVSGGGDMPPELSLSGETRRAAASRELELSLTHSRDVAAAVVVVR